MKKTLALIVSLLFLLPVFALAQPAGNNNDDEDGFGNFEAPLPGTGENIDAFVKGGDNPFTRYANIVIQFIIGGVVVIGLISVVIGGYIYMTAGGSAERVSTAKSYISAALLGIALALSAYLILNTISPQFADNLKDPERPQQNN